MINILITKIIYLVSIICDARSDGYKIKHNKINHTLETLQHIHLFAPLLLWQVESWQMVWITVLSYPIMRVGMFNPLINNYRGSTPWHLGDNLIDNALRPLARIEQTTRFPALSLSYFVMSGFGLFLGFTDLFY